MGEKIRFLYVSLYVKWDIWNGASLNFQSDQKKKQSRKHTHNDREAVKREGLEKLKMKKKKMLKE